MKLLTTFFVILLSINSSCESQVANPDIIINYKAQTRGFIYQLSLNKNTLEINNNNLIKTVEINKEQLSEIEKFIATINFKKINSNISEEDLAVDRAIEGVFYSKVNGKDFTFILNHNNLPNQLKELFNQLENYFQ